MMYCSVMPILTQFWQHPWFSLPLLPFLLALTFFFNEFLTYYVTISSGCAWPILSNLTIPSSRLFVIADIHLLGIYRGHWFDKLRREWQMYRSFQTAVQLLGPDAIFFLGDQFDEGLLGDDTLFNQYATRFDELMHVPEGIREFVLAGNHDIGFHYEISTGRLNRFSKRFMSELVSYVTVGRNHFVLINSMAMERDGCRLCFEAEQQLEHLRQQLDCARERLKNCSRTLEIPYSRPILMQHFPLYRRDDRLCESGPDVAPEPIKSQKFNEKWDCLSVEATDQVLRALNPRAVFDGHTHYGCKTWWPKPFEIWEWTVPSFSWRNTPQPGFLLVSLSESEILVNKCLLPNEKTVISAYVAVALFVTCCIGYCIFRYFKTSRRERYPTYEFIVGKTD